MRDDVVRLEGNRESKRALDLWDAGRAFKKDVAHQAAGRRAGHWPSGPCEVIGAVSWITESHWAGRDKPRLD
jgi:hypothetical protein